MKAHTIWLYQLMILVFVFLPTVGSAEEASPFEGQWIGELSVANQAFPLILNVKSGREGLTATLDSPAQGAKDIPVSKVIVEQQSITFKITAAQAIYTATLSNDKEQIVGKWKQGPNTLDLSMKKSQQTSPPLTINRPQHPTAPFEYSVEEVTFRNTNADISLAGTLTLPNKKGSYPAVVMITGSGPQDRDQTFMGHKTFWVIADYLTRNGMAVLRFDDRGIGKSQGNFASATSLDFANDVSAGVDFLAQHENIETSTIGLIGHSEGGLIAPIVADINTKVAFLISMAGPGIGGNEIAITQIEDSLLSIGLSAATASAGSDITRQLNQTVLTHTDSSTLEQALVASHQKAWSSLPERARAELTAIGGGKLSEARIEQLSSNWTKYFLQHDPKPYLKKLKIPVLAIHGTKDTQLAANANLDLIEAYLGNNHKLNQIQRIEGVNHLFQPAKTGSMSEYAKIETTFSEPVLEDIAMWLYKVTQ